MTDVNAQSQITQPVKENAAPKSARVFSMPARYRHGAVVNVIEPQKSGAPALAPLAPATPLPPKPIPPPLVKPIGKQTLSHSGRAFLIAGVVVAIALGISGYLLVRSMQKNKPIPIVPTPTEIPVVTAPVETPVEVVPPVSSTPSTEPAPGSISPFPTVVTPGVDSDSDGLTDVEETLVYGTDPRLPDTDGDGFLDGNEVFHHYNPNGTAPADLLGAKLAQVLEAPTYSLLYPTKWSLLPSDKNGYIISTTTGESLTIEPATKESTQSLVDWYAQSGKDGTPSITKSKNGFPMMIASSQLIAYLDLGTSVLTFTYTTATKGTIDYLQTFQMMLNSLQKKGL